LFGARVWRVVCRCSAGLYALTFRCEGAASPPYELRVLSVVKSVRVLPVNPYSTLTFSDSDLLCTYGPMLRVTVRRLHRS
jgi:hypothetical protein